MLQRIIPYCRKQQIIVTIIGTNDKTTIRIVVEEDKLFSGELAGLAVGDQVSKMMGTLMAFARNLSKLTDPSLLE